MARQGIGQELEDGERLTVLPEPLSPTMARVSPLSRLKLT
jgi:hypothetical protein